MQEKWDTVIRPLRTHIVEIDNCYDSNRVGETNDRSVKGTSDYVWALRDIDFKVEQGDVVGIIGRNGAGKSTLLKLLSRVTAPTVGSIRARGRIGSLLSVTPSSRRRPCMHMQGIGFTQKMEIMGFLAFVDD